MTPAKLDEIIEHFKSRIAINKGEQLIPVGGYRRGKRKMKDLDLMTNVTLDKASTRIGYNSSTPITSDRRRLKMPYRGVKIDLVYATNSEWPYALVRHTGDALFLRILQNHIKKKGWLLNQYGLFDRNTKHHIRGTKKLTTEHQIFDFVDFKWHEPYERVMMKEN